MISKRSQNDLRMILKNFQDCFFGSVKYGALVLTALDVLSDNETAPLIQIFLTGCKKFESRSVTSRKNVFEKYIF